MRALVWRHLALLTALAVVFLFLADLLTGAPKRAGGWSGAPLAALQLIPNALYLMVGPIAAIAVGTLRPERRNVGEAVRITLIATAVMLALELITPSNSGGALRSALALDADARHQVSVVLTTYPFNHPRIIAEEGVVRAGMLLLPAVLVGIVLGVGAWVNARVLFRSPRDGMVARWTIAILLVPLATGVIVNWSAGSGYNILFRGQSLLLPLVPYMPALVIAAVGWRTARRQQGADDEPTLDALHSPA